MLCVSIDFSISNWIEPQYCILPEDSRAKVEDDEERRRQEDETGGRRAAAPLHGWQTDRLRRRDSYGLGEVKDHLRSMSRLSEEIDPFWLTEGLFSQVGVAVR